MMPSVGSTVYRTDLKIEKNHYFEKAGGVWSARLGEYEDHLYYGVGFQRNHPHQTLGPCLKVKATERVVGILRADLSHLETHALHALGEVGYPLWD